MADYTTLLQDHVTLTCRSFDRIFLQAYVPRLQAVGQVCAFLRWQRGFRIPSSAAFGKIGEAYVQNIHRFAKEHGIPVVHFEKGQCKEVLAHPHLEAASREGGDGRVVMIRIAQEKASCWRSWKAKGQEHAAHPHMERGRQMAFVNHFYFYPWDPDWGPAFWKTNAYAPYPIWLWLNGQRYPNVSAALNQLLRQARRQMAIVKARRGAAVQLNELAALLGRESWQTSCEKTSSSFRAHYRRR